MPARGPYAKGRAKRDEILEAALDLFAQKGYDRTSVREIARHAGLSQAGLLHHFSTKEELFLEVLRRRDDRATEPEQPAHTHSVDHLIGAVDRNANEPGLVRLFVAMSAESAEDDSEARAFFAERYEWLLGQIAADVRAHQASGDIPPHLDADDAASLLVAAADGLQIQWLLNPDGVDMPARIRSLWEALKNMG
jgi:AcrR family transcriptional regulator